MHFSSWRVLTCSWCLPRSIRCMKAARAGWERWKWWKRWNDIIMMNICGILPNLVIFWFGPFCHPQLDCCEEPARHPTVASRDWSSSRLKVWVSLRMGYPPKNGGWKPHLLDPYPPYPAISRHTPYLGISEKSLGNTYFPNRNYKVES